MQALYQNDIVNIMAGNAIDIRNKLSPGLYKILLQQMQPPMLQKVDNFVLPEKFYGKNNTRAKFILSRYNDLATGNLGALFVGAKGTGKTLLAKTIATEAFKQGIPTLLVDSAINPAIISDFLGKIDHKCIVLFDEFEKNYTTKYGFDSENNGMTQNDLLSMLDGNNINNKLFLFTANEAYHVSNFLLDRPSRIRYYIEFNGLDSTEIEEYCAENLNNKELTERVIKVARNISEFSYDQLVSLVRELNEIPVESVDEVLDMFNLRPDTEKLENTYTIVDMKLPDEIKLVKGKKVSDIISRFEIEFKRGMMSIASNGRWFDGEYPIYANDEDRPDIRSMDNYLYLYFYAENIQLTPIPDQYKLIDDLTGIEFIIKRKTNPRTRSRIDYRVF